MRSGGARVGVVLNPTAGNGRGARARAHVIAGLRSAGLDVADLSGPDAAAATRNARQALPDLDALVVVGGDGMTHLGANVVAGTGVPLGVVGIGSGNDIARDLGLPVRDPAAAVAVLAGALAGHAGHAAVAVDAIAVTGSEPTTPAADGRRWSLGVVCGGVDAAVSDRAHSYRWPRGGARYVRGVLAELAAFSPYGYRLRLDGEEWAGTSALVAVANTPSFGGGMRIAPDADPHDGLLDVVTADGVGRAALLRLLPRVYSGAHVADPRVRVRRARVVELAPAPDQGSPPPVAFADGERLGALPLRCEAVAGAVRVLARTSPA